MAFGLPRHLRGAHRALELLAGSPPAVGEAPRRRRGGLAGEVEEGGRLPGPLADAVAEVLEDPGRVDDVGRVQAVLGVERALELTERGHQPWPGHAREGRAPGPAVARLSRARPAGAEPRDRD